MIKKKHIIAPALVPINVLISFNKKLSYPYCNAPKLKIPLTPPPEITSVS
jgi:hypothetical protein